jgi:diadenosine tetraphosphate (Ap4A) HIT family hydrolase
MTTIPETNGAGAAPVDQGAGAPQHASQGVAGSEAGNDAGNDAESSAESNLRSNADTQPRCELCHDDGGELLYGARGDAFVLRVILVDDADHPGFCRVIWNRHAREITDLTPAERAHLMDAVFRVESALRETMAPDKVNLASLGNMVPHMHWHVIARHADDAHFPAPVWAAPQRAGEPATIAATAGRRRLLPALREAVRRRFLDFPSHTGQTS